MVLVRPATLEDVASLPEVERSAGSLFAAWPGLEWIAGDDVQSEAEHREWIETGLALVAERQTPVAFLNGEFAGEELHIRQIAVRREEQGRGLGRRLVEAALLNALERGLRAVTLTTFREVPWNEPWYARLGFRSLPEEACGERLQGVLEAEALAGLPRARRVAMRLPLHTAEGEAPPGRR